MKALVTGGAGFIGSNIVDQLLEQPNIKEVVVIDNLSAGKLSNVNSRATFVHGDIRNINEIDPYFEGVDVVFHVAAWPRVEPSIKDPVTFNGHNTDGTLNVLECARKHGVKNVVFSSSSSVYGEPKVLPTPESAVKDPMSPYALQKLIGEQYAKLYCDLYGMNIVCLRYFNVYGFREPTVGAYVPVVGIWFRQLRAGKPLTITGDGKQTRDFINVEYVAQANVCAMVEIFGKTLTGFHVFNVGTGRNYELNDVARWISKDITYITERIEPKITLADISETVKAFRGLWNPNATTLEMYVERQKNQ